MKTHLSTVALMLLGLCLYSCQSHNYEAQILSDQDVVASYPENEVITVAQLQQYLLSVPANERWSQQDPVGHYKSIVRKMVVNKRLLSEAMLAAADQEASYLLKKNTLLRTTYTRSFLSDQVIQQQPDEAMLQDYYDENKEQFVLNEKRNVYHVFKAINTANAQSLLNDIRRRLINGESIKLLAQEHSESESRHKEGYLGLIQRGSFPADFDQVVFNLKENVPSEVIKTTEGYHVFFVTDIFVAKTYEYVDVRQQILQNIGLEFTVDVIKKQATQLGVPKDFFIASEDELKKILVSNDPSGVVFETGGVAMTVHEFKFMMTEWLSRLKSTKNQKKLVYLMLQQQAYSEVIYQHMLEAGHVLQQKKIMDQQLELLLVEEFINTKIKSHVNQTPAALKAYYDKNAMRFASPIQVSLQILKLPIVENNNLMPTLENSINDLNAGVITLQDLADQYQGNVESLGFKNSLQLSQLNKKLSGFVFSLDVSQHSVPFTDGQHYYMAKVVDKRPAKIRPLSLIREQVLSAYINDNKTFIFAEITESLLNDLSFDEAVLSSLIQQSASIE